MPDLLRPEGGALDCTVAGGFPVPVLAVHGTLAIATAPVVRRNLLKCLADQPAAVIVDLSGVRLAEDLAGLVFAAVSRHAAAWPGSQLLLCGLTPQQHKTLDRMAVTRFVTICDTVAAARLCTDRLGHPLRLSELLPALPESAAAARRIVDEACADWGVPAVVDTAQIVATELVTNAVRHARTSMTLNLSLRGRYLHLAVRDGSPHLPQRRFPDDPSEESGRGLMVLDAYATAWGCVPANGGKVVWATLPAQPRRVGRRD